MTEVDWEAMGKIWYSAISKSLDAAREDYLQQFKVAFKDSGIDQEFRRLFEDALDKRKTEVAIPINVALALALRSGGRSKGHPVRHATRRYQKNLLELAEQNWAENAKKMKRGEAKKKAAEDALKFYGTTRPRINLTTLLDRMGRKRKPVSGN